MDKYEVRRQQLILLLKQRCNNKKSELASKLGVTDSYVNRMFYPEGKAGRKRIGEDMVENITREFDLPVGWMDAKEVIDQDDARLLAIYHAASPSDKLMIMQIMSKFEATPLAAHPASPTNSKDEPKPQTPLPNH